MTKEEMIKSFMSKAPKEMVSNVQLFDEVLPPLFEEDRTTLESVLGSARRLEYDVNKALIIATLDDCQYCLQAFSDKVKAWQFSFQEYETEVFIDLVTYELILLERGYSLARQFDSGNVSKKSDDSYEWQLISDGDVKEVEGKNRKIIKKEYKYSKQQKGVASTNEEAAINCFDSVKPLEEVMAVKDSAELERIQPKRTVNVY